MIIVKLLPYGEIETMKKLRKYLIAAGIASALAGGKILYSSPISEPPSQERILYNTRISESYKRLRDIGGMFGRKHLETTRFHVPTIKDVEDYATALQEYHVALQLVENNPQLKEELEKAKISGRHGFFGGFFLAIPVVSLIAYGISRLSNRQNKPRDTASTNKNIEDKVNGVTDKSE